MSVLHALYMYYILTILCDTLSLVIFTHTHTHTQDIQQGAFSSESKGRLTSDNGHQACHAVTVKEYISNIFMVKHTYTLPVHVKVPFFFVVGYIFIHINILYSRLKETADRLHTYYPITYYFVQYSHHSFNGSLYIFPVALQRSQFHR